MNQLEKLKNNRLTSLREKVNELVDYSNKTKPLADGISIFSQETSTGIMLSAKKQAKQNISSAPASASTAQPELYICKITGTSTASGYDGYTCTAYDSFTLDGGSNALLFVSMNGYLATGYQLANNSLVLATKNNLEIVGTY